MIDIDEQKKIAVLIDADNTPVNKLRSIIQEVAVYGHVITKRAYGDFSLDTLKNWKKELNDNAIIPVQQFAYTRGKNSSDSAMIIDAMDLLYTDKYDAFVLVLVIDVIVRSRFLLVARAERRGGVVVVLQNNPTDALLRCQASEVDVVHANRRGKMIPSY